MSYKWEAIAQDLTEERTNMTFNLEQAVQEANREIPEAVSSELYNAALEALDDDEAHKSYDPNPRLPERLRDALRAWTDMEYRKSRERVAELGEE